MIHILGKYRSVKNKSDNGHFSQLWNRLQTTHGIIVQTCMSQHIVIAVYSVTLALPIITCLLSFVLFWPLTMFSPCLQKHNSGAYKCKDPELACQIFHSFLQVKETCHSQSGLTINFMSVNKNLWKLSDSFHQKSEAESLAGFSALLETRMFNPGGTVRK